MTRTKFVLVVLVDSGGRGRVARKRRQRAHGARPRHELLVVGGGEKGAGCWVVVRW